MTHVLAIDQGTTNTKALLFSRHAEVLSQSSRQVAVTHPAPGFAEQSSEAIWDGTRAAVQACIEARGTSEIGALALTNQRESILLWDRETGQAVGPCVSWQCRRSAGIIEQVRTPQTEALALDRTGLVLDPMFSAGKLAWLMRNVPEAEKLANTGRLCAGTVDSWLVFRLTGGAVHGTDHGNASRTQLFDIDRLTWDEALCDMFGVPASILPRSMASDTLFGTTAAASGLPAGIPIHAVMGDSHAALYGHGARAPGAIKATLGTGTSLMTLAPADVSACPGIARTIAWTAGNSTSYALEGNILVSAQALSIMARLLGLEDAQALSDLAAKAEDSGGVTLVPAFAGLGAPHWDDAARGMLDGMNLATTQAHIARATLEAVAHQIADVLDGMGPPDLHRVLHVDGGASINNRLLGILSDITGGIVQPATLPELSAWGVAAMAGVACGVWTDAEVMAANNRDNTQISPGVSPAQRGSMRALWHGALARARFRPTVH